jgi:hypothetical protein
MQYKEFTQTHSEDLIEQISSILETHMIGRTVIVKGKKGKVIKQVGSDGKTESDEIYQVKFEDGTVADIPARDMEMQGDDNKKIGENEAEELVKEAKKVRVKTQEYDGEHLDEKIVTGKDGVKRLKGAFHWPSEVIRPSGRRKAKSSQLPRQLKNKKTEMMVSHPKTGAVSVIDKKDWEKHEKQGYGVAESVVKEAKRVRVKTQSGTTERVSPDDLKAAGDVFDRIKRLKLAIADKQHAAHQKKVDKSRIRQDSVEYDGESLDERTSPLPKSTSFSSVYSYKDKDHKFVTKLTNIGGAVDRKRKEVRFNFDNAAARTRFRNKNKNVLKGI